MNKEEIEKHLKEHQFEYRWHKDYLFIKKLGIGWKTPLFEFEYGVTPIGVIIDSYTSKPGNSVKFEKDDYLYSVVVE